MALFDREQQRIVVRVVYDGVERAGKTTNLQQLCSFFTTRRRGELYTPEVVDGRTAYFDWLTLEGGLVAGFPLRCQLLTVPGQATLSKRRFYLLQRADVVVFVCESTERGIADARPMLGIIKSFIERPAPGLVPLVLQANKQDLPGAQEPSRVAEALGTGAAPVVAARAHEGVGVRETAVLAIRAAANEVQRLVLERGIDALVGEAETGESLYDALRAADASAPASAPRVLQVTLSPAPPPSEAPIAEEAGVDLSEPDTPPPTRRDPPLPQADVPSGYIWPAATGRDILRRLVASEEVARRDDLVGRTGTADGSGASDAIIYEAGLWCLKTSGRRRYADVDDARAALLHLARRKILLGSLMPERTVLCLRQDTRGALWLWTVSPWLSTMRTLMNYAWDRRDGRALGVELARYATAAVQAMVLASRNRVVLDVHQSNFAVLRDELFYLDDDVSVGAELPAIGHALLQRVEEYAELPGAIEVYVAELERGIAGLSSAELSRIGIEASLRANSPRSDVARRVSDRLVDLLSSRGRAAG